MDTTKNIIMERITAIQRISTKTRAVVMMKGIAKKTLEARALVTLETTTRRNHARR
jgi:hypothetical protein